MTRKITSLEELQAMRDRAQAEIDLRTAKKELRLTVHMGTCGIAAGARDVLMAILQELEGQAGQKVSVQQSGCAGLCDREPMISITDAAGHVFRYGRLDRNKVRQIIQEHVVRGTPVTEFLLMQ